MTLRLIQGEGDVVQGTCRHCGRVFYGRDGEAYRHINWNPPPVVVECVDDAACEARMATHGS